MITTLSPQEITLFRQLKRVAIVIILMARLNQPTRAVDLAEILEINYETARAYLKSLRHLGLIAYAHGQGWMVTAGGRGLLSPAVLVNAENPRFPDSVVVVDSVNRKVNDKQQQQTKENAENPRPLHNKSAENPRFSANYLELLECGIAINPRTQRLAELDFVNPDYIRGHYLQITTHPPENVRNMIGLLITILESGARAPKLNHNRHLKACTCDQCHHNRYTDMSLYCGVCQQTTTNYQEENTYYCIVCGWSHGTTKDDTKE